MRSIMGSKRISKRFAITLQPRIEISTHCRTVQEFVEQITKHFENEEQGGYFANAVRRAPHLADQAEELLQEHEELSEMIVSVNVLARSGVETNAWWEQMEADIARFRVRLLKHEAAETELLQSAYTDDIGAGD
jgi:hypothetical protein